MLCSKNYLRNGESLAKICLIQLQLKFNFKQIVILCIKSEKRLLQGLFADLSNFLVLRDSGCPYYIKKYLIKKLFFMRNA